MKRFLMFLYILKYIQSQQQQDSGTFFQSQLPLIRSMIPLIRQQSGNLPGIDRVIQDLERIQRLTPDDIREEEKRQRELELNPTTSPGNSKIIQPIAPAARRPSFKYPEIKNSLNGPNELLRNVGGPYGGGLGLQNIYG
ncbi:hypothetical protein ACKWTF_004519 [Chironomus riparius]